MKITTTIRLSFLKDIKSRYLMFYFLYGVFQGCYYGAVVGALIK